MIPPALMQLVSILLLPSLAPRVRLPSLSPRTWRLHATGSKEAAAKGTLLAGGQTRDQQTTAAIKKLRMPVPRSCRSPALCPGRVSRPHGEHHPTAATKVPPPAATAAMGATTTATDPVLHSRREVMAICRCFLLHNVGNSS